MLKFSTLLLLCITIVGCTQQLSDSNAELGSYEMSENSATPDQKSSLESSRSDEPSEPTALKKGSKLIKNGVIEFEVTDLESAKSRVDTLLEQVEGYYENEQYNSYGNRVSYSLDLRIPSERFDKLIDHIESGAGELKSKNITTKDVTGEYVDLNIRLDNNLSYLSQYKEILKRAQSVKEILEVQDKIRRIEEEIDSKKGRLEYLNDQVSYSTLHLTLTELVSSEMSNNPRFGRRFINAFRNGVQYFLSFIIGVVNMWPFLLILMVLMIGGRPLISRWRRNKKNTLPK